MYISVDLSLYKNESQIEKKTPTKRKISEPKSTKKISSTASSIKQKKTQKSDDDSDDDVNYEPSNKRKKTPFKNSAKKRAPPPKSTAKVCTLSTEIRSIFYSNFSLLIPEANASSESTSTAEKCGKEHSQADRR